MTDYFFQWNRNRRIEALSHFVSQKLDKSRLQVATNLLIGIQIHYTDLKRKKTHYLISYSFTVIQNFFFQKFK